MAIAEELVINIKAQVQQALNSLKTTEKQLDNVTTSAKKTTQSVSDMGNNISSSIKRLAVQFGVFKTVVEGVKFNAFIQQTEIAFGVFIGNVDEGKAKVKELFDFAIKTPLTFKETITASRQLLAYGFAASDLQKQLQLLGDVSTGVGTRLSDLAYVYGTLKTQNRAYTRDLMQFAMRGIPIYEYLSKVLNINREEIQKLTQQGRIGFDAVQAAFTLMTSSGERFGNMMTIQMKNLSGMFNIIRDITEIIIGDLTKGIADELYPVLKNISSWMVNNRKEIISFGEDTGRAFSTVIDILKLVFTVLSSIPSEVYLIAASFLMTNKLVSVFVGILPKLKNIVSVFSELFLAVKTFGIEAISVFAPTGMFVVGIGLAIVAIAKLNDKMKDIQKTAEEVRNKATYQKMLLELKNGIYSNIPGMTKEMADLANKYNTFNKAIENANAIIEWKKQLNELTNSAKENKNVLQNSLTILKLALTTLDVSGKNAVNNIQDALGNLYYYMKTLPQDMQTALIDSLANESAWREATRSENDNAIKHYRSIIKNIISTIERGSPEVADKIKSLMNLIYATEKGAGLYGVEKEESPILASLLGDEEGRSKNIRKIKDDLYYIAKLRAEQIEIMQDNENIAFKQQVALVKEQYSWLSLMYAVDGDINGELKSKYELEKKLNKLYEDRYDTLLNGEDKYWAALKREIALMMEKEDYIGAMTGQAIMGLQGTEVGKMAAGANNPALLAVSALTDFLKSIESVNDILNPFATILKGVSMTIAPFLNSVFRPFSDLLKTVGITLGALSTILLTLNPALMAIRATASILADGFLWLYNYPIRMFANGIIDIMNGIISALNKLPFVDIDYIDRLEAIYYLNVEAENAAKEAAEAAEEAARLLKEALEKQLDTVQDQIKFLQDKMKDLYNKQIDSLKDLYEVGAITGAQYASQAKTLSDQYASYFLSDLEIQYDQLNTLNAIATEITALKAVEQGLKDRIADTSAAETAAQEAATAAAAQAAADLYAKQQETMTTQLLNTYGGITKENSAYDSMSEAMNKPWYKISGSEYNLAKDITSGGLSSDSLNLLASFFGVAVSDLQSIATILKMNYEMGRTSFASGTSNIPQDMAATVHKGEGIIPKDFMEAIRSGALTLGGPEGTGQNGAITINIGGSVIEERNLTRTIVNAINQNGKRGYLPT